MTSKYPTSLDFRNKKHPLEMRGSFTSLAGGLSSALVDSLIQSPASTLEKAEKMDLDNLWKDLKWLKGKKKRKGKNV